MMKISSEYDTYFEVIMKRVLLFFLFTGLVSTLNAKESRSSVEGLYKNQMLFVGKYSLETHWNAVQDYIQKYIFSVQRALEDNSGEIGIQFDRTHFLNLVHNIQLKLSMPSVTQDNKMLLLESIEPYLGESGILEEKIKFIRRLYSSRLKGDRGLSFDLNIQYMITGLTLIQEKLKQDSKN